MTTIDTQISKEASALAPVEMMGGSDDLDEVVSDTRQFVTFIAGDEVFAVDMAPVQEIIRMPTIVRVPLAPQSLQGLANLRGRVLPIISLRRVFGFADLVHDDATRAVVIDISQPLGFVVDKVVSVVSVEPGKLESVNSIKTTVNTDFLSGIIKDVGGHAMTMVLDFAKLIDKEFSEISAAAGSALRPGASEPPAARLGESAIDELQLISFVVAGQEYAIAIEDVQEIVQMPDIIVRPPHSESHVLGVMTLRDHLLPLVSLRRMFNLPPQDADDRSRIVVVSLGGTSVGIVLDSVNEVLRVARTDVEALPDLFARDGSLNDVSNICKLESGSRLVAIISARNLFHNSALKEALTVTASLREEVPGLDLGDDEANGDDEQVVVFCIGKEEFGVPIESVQEIVRVPEQLTRVPKTPAFVEGVINLRGTVLPVLDLRSRLGLPRHVRTDRQRIMVILIADLRTGFIVDSVAEVLKIHKSAIEPTPQLSREQGKLLSRMANLEKQKRMVQLIAPDFLVLDGEVADLAALAA